MQRTVMALVVAFFLMSAQGAWAQHVVDLQASWPKGSGLKKASDPMDARFRIVGPGRLDIHLVLDPYRSAGKAANIPIAWTRYLPDGRMRGWGVIGEMVNGPTLLNTIYQNGRPARNFLEGVPLEYRLSIRLTPGEYLLGVRLAAPAIMYGGSGVTQWPQKARLTVDFAAEGGKAPPPTATSPAGAPLTGRWDSNAGGYHNTLEITQGATGYVVRMSAPGGRWDFMRDVRFVPSSGDLQFTRRAAGYPDQVFRGRVSGNQISGQYGWATNMKSTNAWTCTRLK